jgi:hypothetical protein
MPLTRLQQRTVTLLAAHRNPESYVAGGAVLHVEGIRLSKDLDIFHDRERDVGPAARADAGLLAANGLRVSWERQDPTMYRAEVADGVEATRLDWVVDTDYRFFPTVPDPLFGYVLHPADLATNKLLAAADRFEVRDAVDLLWIDARLQPLGAVAWAAAEKNPGWTPEGLLAEVRAKARYRDDMLAAENLTEPLSAAELNTRLRQLVAAGEALVAAFPEELEVGLLLRPDGGLARPDPDRPETMEGLVVHHGSRKGSWPSSPEIGSAMLRERPLPR